MRTDSLLELLDTIDEFVLRGRILKREGRLSQLRETTQRALSIDAERDVRLIFKE